MFEIQNWGTVEYVEALGRMRTLHAEVAAGRRGPVLIVCNHPPVFTAGRRFDPRQALGPLTPGSGGGWQVGGIPLVLTERGGLFTYHDPGQIILYPVMRLTGRTGEFRRLVEGLEEMAIRFVGEFGVAAERRCGQPGVFCAGGKIASLGLAVQRQTTLHGLAINVRTNKTNFALIAACGVAGQSIANVADYVSVPERALELGARAAAIMEAMLSPEAVGKDCVSPRRHGDTEKR